MRCEGVPGSKMKFSRSKAIGTPAVAAIIIVVAIVAAGGAYVASSGSKSTVTQTVTSTSVSTATGQPSLTTITATISGTVTTETQTLTSTATSISTSVSTSIATSTATSTSVSVSTATQTTVATPVLPATLPTPASPITQAGSSLLFPLFQLWAANFTQLYSNVKINTAAGGSGAGQTGAEQNTTNIGASDVFLTPAQVQTYPDVLNIPVAVSAQAINYNIPGMPNTTHLNFTGNVLAGIYNGSITYWNAPAILSLQSASVQSLLPHQTIIPLHRSDSSGDTGLFTGYLSDTSPDWAKNVGSGTTVSWPSVPSAEAENGNSGMLSACAATQYCIAYIGVSYLAQANTDGLGNAALKNLAGNFVQLTTPNVSAAVQAQYTSTPANERYSLIYGPGATSYPIVNYEYALVQKNQPNTTLQQDIQALLWYATLPNDGNSAYFLNQVGFVPLPPSIDQLTWAQIDSITG
jgi:phosphate transport system substrate-binding protein